VAKGIEFGDDGEFVRLCPILPLRVEKLHSLIQVVLDELLQLGRELFGSDLSVLGNEASDGL
jgi:hypothetical protein